MNEAETRAALKTAGWGVVEGSRIRREEITQGRLQGAGKRAPKYIANHALTYRPRKDGLLRFARNDDAKPPAPPAAPPAPPRHCEPLRSNPS